MTFINAYKIQRQAQCWQSGYAAAMPEAPAL
jgi:hypothetical protein